jgi:hypothetical protein
MSILFANGEFEASLEGIIAGHQARANSEYPQFRADGEAIDHYRLDHNAATLTQHLRGLSPVHRQAIQASFRMDSAPAGGNGGGLFLARQLEYRMKRVLEMPLPPLSGLELFTLSTEVPAGATQFSVSRTYDRGSATIYRSAAQRPIPTATLTQREELFPVRNIVSSFGASIFEMNSAGFANFSLWDRGTGVARRAIAELQNTLIWNGSTIDGLYGVLNYPWLDKWVPAQVFSSATDALLMAGVIFSAIEYPEQNSKSAFKPTDVVFSVTMYNFLSRTPTGAAAPNKTLLQYIAENNSAGIPLSRFHKAQELNAAGPGGTEGMLVYRRDQDGIMVVIPQTTTALPIQNIGFTTTQYLYAGYGGVVQADVGNNLLVWLTKE